MYSIFGGDVKDLRVWLAEGRFSDGWEPKNREALGHTIAVCFLILPGRSVHVLTRVLRTASANHLTCDRIQYRRETEASDWGYDLSQA
jgi:hypothetical protein